MPFDHRMVVVEEHRYRVITKDGTVHEMRFPYRTVEEKPDRWIVRIWDLRYQGPDTDNPRGIGSAEVEVPRGRGN